MKQEIITDRIFLIQDFINTGVLKSGKRALLIDCADFITPVLLAEYGIEQVEAILFTQHRRTLTAGLYNFVGQQVDLYSSHQDKMLFEQADQYWADDKNRWHLAHYQPGPLVLPRPVQLKAGLADQEVLSWRGFKIRALATPGPTDGSISYLVQDQGKAICFCGDLIYGLGQQLDLFSLQKGHKTDDYHGFMGNVHQLLDSLAKLADNEPDILLPAHGPVVDQVQPALSLATKRLEELYANYYSTSSMNYYAGIYFPGYFSELADQAEKMQPAEQSDYPDCLHYITGTTSSVLVSAKGAALVIDCYNETALASLRQMQAAGVFARIDACWITHYHHDHVEAINQLKKEFGCQIMAIDLTAHIVSEPAAHYLPCVSPHIIQADLAASHGQAWHWHEFKLTAYRCPGQTLYDGALLIEKEGLRLLAIGDSFSPTGLDDYSSQNRNLLAKGRGFDFCLDLIRQLQPDLLVNQHQEKAFSFTDSQLDYLEKKLAERRKISAQLLPWPEADFGLDESWLRTYPYAQTVRAGASFTVEVQMTNHARVDSELELEAVLPPGWSKANELVSKKTTAAALTSGSCCACEDRPDTRVSFNLTAPATAVAGRYIILFKVRCFGRYLGQFRHALLDVGP